MLFSVEYGRKRQWRMYGRWMEEAERCFIDGLDGVTRKELRRKKVTHTSYIQLLDNVVHKPRHRRLGGQVTPPQICRHAVCPFSVSRSSSKKLQ